MLAKKGILVNSLSRTEGEYLDYACKAIQRLLPHVEVLHWEERAAEGAGSAASAEEGGVRFKVIIRPEAQPEGRSLSALIRRKKDSAFNAAVAHGGIDTRERDICALIAQEIHEVLGGAASYPEASLPAMQRVFDETIVAKHIKQHHRLELDVSALLGAMHTLAEQTYENKALSFGCVLDPNAPTKDAPIFPSDYIKSKKFKALSDGYRTAYVISRFGCVKRFVDLDRYTTKRLTEKHFYPEWARLIAQASREKRCGISLSRQGDILVFDEGTLRFTYRYGKWQYWNHSHLINLLRDRARAQKIPKRILGNVVGAIYRAALDVSFRRSGALFVILHNQASLPKIVKNGDALGAAKSEVLRVFDEIVREQKIQKTARIVVVELASLDGAIVLNNAGVIKAYGAVLQPKRIGHLRGSEGSRTKAAIGASNYGIAVKVSSDGDITIYHRGREYLKV